MMNFAYFVYIHIFSGLSATQLIAEKKQSTRGISRSAQPINLLGLPRSSARITKMKPKPHGTILR